MAGQLEDPSVLRDLQVQPLEGTVELSRSDLELGDGPSSIALLRTHRPGWGDLRNFGTQWTSVLDARLVPQKDGSVVFLTPTGDLQLFERDQDGVLRAVFGMPHAIEEHAGGSSLRLGTQFFAFDAEGRLERMNTAHTSLKLIRDRQGLVSKVDTSAGPITVERDDRGALVALSAQGQRVAYTRDDAGNLLQIAAQGRQETYAYDAAGRLCAAGAATIAYDAQGRVTQVEAKGFPTARYARDEEGRTVTTTVGETTTVLEVSKDGLTHTETTDGTLSVLEFDERGRPVKAVRGDEVLELAYDAQGRLVQQGDTRFLYGRGVLPTAAIQKDGAVTKFSYDDQGRMRSYSAGEIATQFRYDPDGRLTQVQGQGEDVRFAYDSHGLLTQVVTPEGRTRFSRDHEGRLSMVHGPDGSLTEVSYQDGLEVHVSLDKAGNTVREVRYDALGRLVYEQDLQGRIKTLSYDEAGQLATLGTPQGTLASFAYSDTGAFEGLTDANGNPVKVLDGGKRIVIQDKASGERIAEFDDQGRLLEETKNGVTTRFVYDEAGRVVQRKTPEGLERFAYDADGNLTSLHGPQGGLELAYENGKLVRLEASPLGLAVEHRYDAKGNKVASKLPWGEVHYAYDEADRLTGVQTPAGDWIRFELDAQGRRVAAHYPGGVDTTFAYTGERLSSIVTTKDGETLEQRVYGYSFDGTVESVETLDGVTRFTHDAAGQLIEAKGPQGLVRYAYDAMGNRTAETVDGETVESVYGEGNRIVKRGDVAFTHHPNGAIASKGEASYRYTSKGQLAEVSYADGSAIRYGYAPNGTRLWREDQNGKTFYLPGLNGTLGEFDQDRKLVTGYVLGGALDEVLAASHGAEQVFYHVDLVRSVTAMTTAEGKLAASFDYDAFGRELAATGPAAEWNQIRYASRPVDLATGDYDYRARTYAPELGRFTSPDPVSFLGGVNLYAYVENAPLALNDPLGLFPGQGLIEDAAGGLVDLGRDTVGVVTDGAQAVGSGLATAGRATVNGIATAGRATVNGIATAGRATVSALATAGRATASALATAGRATGRFLRDAGYFAVGLAVAPFVGAYYAGRWAGEQIVNGARAFGRGIAAIGRGIGSAASWVWNNRADIGYGIVGLAVLPFYATYKLLEGGVRLGIAAVRGIVAGIGATINFLKRLRLPFEIDFRSPLGPDGGEFSSPLLARSFETGTQLAVALEIRQILAELWPTIGSGLESEKLDELRGRAVSDGARSVIDQLQQVYEDGADAGTSSDDLRNAAIALAAAIGADPASFGAGSTTVPAGFPR
ncbi:MAG: RHS repeat-associated core domain-containing protein [Planctomycetota bacterium]